MAREFKKSEVPKLKDDSLMPNGTHKSMKMEDVPAKYLMYIYDNDMARSEVKTYIEENMEVILKQAKAEGYASRE